MQKFRDVLSSWEEGRLSQLEAAALLGCSERQFRRYRDRFLDEGEEGLKDRRLGRPSARAIAASERAGMLELYRGRHRGWTAKHFHDWGKRHHEFAWGYTWTKTQLHAAGLLQRAPRRGAHRRKRERKPCAGMMLHQDGSRHVWLDGQGEMDLIVTMDDATSCIYSAFLVEEESTESTFRAGLETFSEHGLPCALYTDRASHYFVTPEANGPVDKVHLTQVGRALSRLGVEHIPAYSPEARGRSERMFGTLQDRLVKELALAQLRDMTVANRWIKEHYLPEHNRLFAHAPTVKDNAFVAVAYSDLVETLCAEHERIVSRDNTVSWEGLRLQIPESPIRAHFVKARVKVRRYPDGRLALFHGPRRIAQFGSDGSPAAMPVTAVPAQRSKAAFSPASRDGLETAKCVARPERRPPLTRSAPAATGLPCRKGLECTA
jgi:transposase